MIFDILLALDIRKCEHITAAELQWAVGNVLLRNRMENEDKQFSGYICTSMHSIDAKQPEVELMTKLV